jgi:hypothetical protein
MRKKRVIVIARRELVEVGSGLRATAEILQPEEVSTDVWRCGYRLTGVGDEKLKYAPGADGVQALFMAFEMLRAGVERSGRSFNWQGALGDGDAGFYRHVPFFYGYPFYKKVVGLVDEQIKMFAEAAIAKRGNPEKELGLVPDVPPKK